MPNRSAIALIPRVVCAALLLLFAVLSYSAALTKSATYDEPHHVLGGWVALHEGDFRVDFSNPPLPFYWAGIVATAALLVYEHSLVRPGDLRRLDAAFFTMNGVISVVFFAFVALDVLVT